MDGLEATELKLSKVIGSAITFRLDSDYYRKQYLADEAVIVNNPERFQKLRSLGLEVNGSAFYPALEPFYGSGNFPFIRVADVKSYVDFDNCARIPEGILPNFPTLKLIHLGDIVLTKGGSIARAGLVTEEGAASRDLIFINSSKLDEAAYIYLSLYFQTDFCNRLLVRSSSMSVQPHLTLTLVKDVAVFKTTRGFQSELLRFVKKGRHCLEKSKALYAEAENLLLEEFGLKDWQSIESTTSVKLFSESFVGKGRIDAEYYHPEKQRVLDGLAQLDGKTVNEHFISVNEILSPTQITSDESVQNYDLDDALQFFIDEKESVSAFELGSTKNRFKKGDVVVSRLRSYLKEIALVDTPETANCVGSSEFIVLRSRSKDVSPELLLVYLRSLPVQRILKWCQSGSNHPRFMEEDLLSIKMPEKLIGIQQQIKQIIRAAIEAGRDSKRLLEIAKRGVEIAIEQDETAALAWMDEQTRLAS